MLDPKNKEAVFEATRRITTKEKWEILLSSSADFKKVVMSLHEEGRYSSKTAACLSKFKSGAYKPLKFAKTTFKKTTLNDLSIMSDRDLNAYMLKVRKNVTTETILSWFDDFSDKMTLETLSVLLTSHNSISKKVTLPVFGESEFRRFYLETNSPFSKESYSFYIFNEFDYQIYRDDLLSMIKNFSKEDLMCCNKKSNYCYSGIFQSVIESYLERSLATIDEMGVDFYKRLYESKINDLNCSGIYLKSEVLKNLDILSSLDFKGRSVIVSSLSFKMDDLIESELLKLKNNNIVPLNLSREKIKMYGRGDYFCNLFNAIQFNDSMCKEFDINKFIEGELRPEEWLNLYEAGYSYIGAGIHDAVFYANYIMDGDQFNFNNMAEIKKLNEKI